jgi:hypothetical protein
MFLLQLQRVVGGATDDGSPPGTGGGGLRVPVRVWGFGVGIGFRFGVLGVFHDHRT